ncbi:MAG: hypothetical protein V4496_03110 [Pseudomonadota bacterium]
MPNEFGTLATARDIAEKIDIKVDKKIDKRNYLKRFYDKDRRSFLEYMTKIAIDIEASHAKDWNNPVNIGRSLKAFAGVDAKSNEVCSVLAALAKKINASSAKLCERHISDTLYGLQAMTADSAAVRAVLAALADKIEHSTEELSAQAIGNTLYGLQKMPANSDGVQAVLVALAKKINASSAQLSAQNIGNALYGLQVMTADSAEVRAVLAALTKKINTSFAQLSTQNIGNALYGLKFMTADSDEVRAVLAALADKIEYSTEELSAQAIGNALYGLQSMTADSAEVRAVLVALTKKINTSSAQLNVQEIGNALYGLQSMTADSVDVQAVLAALVNKIKHSTAKLDSQAIGNALYGLQAMSTDSVYVQAMLAALANKIEHSIAELDAQAIGNELYGLQKMSADSAGVQAVLAALARKIQTSPAQLNGQEIGIALYGLQKMSADSAGVQAVLAALANKIEHSIAELKAQAIGNVLYGLQKMSADSAGVQAMLAALANKIEHSTAELDAQTIGNALYGLQAMTADSVGVQAVLSALAEKIEISSAQLSEQNIGNALYGLQKMSADSAGVQVILAALAKKIDESKADLGAQAIGGALHGLQKMSAEHEEVLSIVDALTRKISEAKVVLTSIQIFCAAQGLKLLASSKDSRVLALLQCILEKTFIALDAMACRSMLRTLGEVGDSNQAIAIINHFFGHFSRVGKFNHSKELSSLFFCLGDFAKKHADMSRINMNMNGLCELLEQENIHSYSVQECLNLLFGLTSFQEKQHIQPTDSDKIHGIFQRIFSSLDRLSSLSKAQVIHACVIFYDELNAPLREQCHLLTRDILAPQYFPSETRIQLESDLEILKKKQPQQDAFSQQASADFFHNESFLDDALTDHSHRVAVLDTPAPAPKSDAEIKHKKVEKTLARNNQIYALIEANKPNDLMKLLGVTEATHASLATYAESNHVQNFIPNSKQDVAKNQANLEREKDNYILVRDFFKKTDKVVLTKLIQRRSSNFFAIVLKGCAEYFRYKLIKNNAIAPIIASLPCEELKTFIQYCNSEQKNFKLTLFCDSESVLSLLNMLTERGVRYEKQREEKKLTLIKKLQQDILKRAIQFHTDSKHPHVIDKLEAAKKELDKGLVLLSRANEAEQEDLVIIQKIMTETNQQAQRLLEHSVLQSRIISYTPQLSGGVIKKRSRIEDMSHNFSINNIKGLRLEKVPGDGNCLYHAIAFYCRYDYRDLRNRVVSEMRAHPENYRPFVSGLLSSGKTYEDYVNGVAADQWGDDPEIQALVCYMRRPILIVYPNGRIAHRDMLDKYPDKSPIFVYYNGHNHYDALIQDNNNLTVQQILDQFAPFNQQTVEETSREDHKKRRLNDEHSHQPPGNSASLYKHHYRNHRDYYGPSSNARDNNTSRPSSNSRGSFFDHQEKSRYHAGSRSAYRRK